MRDDLIIWLNKSNASVASQTITKVMRLAQITSGFVGGIEDQGLDEDYDLPSYLKKETLFYDVPADERSDALNCGIQEIGDEKQKLFIKWYEEQLSIYPNFKAIVWCRFRNEVERLRIAIAQLFPKIKVGTIWNGPKDEREYAIRLMNPETAPEGPAILIGTAATGAFGLNFTAANTAVYMSNERRLLIRIQSEDRLHRPGQTKAVNYFDIVACGPKGQKTIDHQIIKMLWSHRDLAEMTTSGWIDALKEE